jgi:WD40 repeat protein
LKLWDFANRRELRTLTGHTGLISDVAFSPDGNWIISCGIDKTFRLWETSTGRQMYSVTADAFGLSAVAFLPGGRQVLTGGYEGKLVLRDVATGAQLKAMEHKDNPGAKPMIHSIAVTRDGRFALTGGVEYTGKTWGGTDARLKLWDLATGNVVRFFAGHSEQVKSVVLSPDGRRAASTGMDATVRIWDVDTGAEIQKLPGGQLGNVAFSHDGRFLVSGGNVTRIYEVASGRELHRLKMTAEETGGKAGEYYSAANVFTPDGRLVTASFATHIWDVATGRRTGALENYSFPLMAMAPSPDGRTIAVGGFQSVETWDSASGRRAARIPSDSDIVWSMAYTGDGRHIVTGSDLHVRVIDVASGRVVRKLSGHSGQVSAVAVSDDGTRILSGGGHRDSMWKGIASTQFDGSLRLWDLASGQPVRVLEKAHTSMIQGVTMSRDGRRGVSSGLIDGTRAWDLATGAQLWKGPDHVAEAALAISPDGAMLAAGGMELKLRSMADGTQVRTFKGHDNLVTAVGFSADGKLLASGSQDNTIRVWNAGTGTEVRALRGHTGAVTGVRFSADGGRIISSGHDSTLRIWDAATGRQLALLMTFKDGEWLAITPDGYFSASSPKAAANVNVARGNQAYEVSQFYDVFYRPDIVEASLAGRDTKGLVALTVDDAMRNPPPVVGAITVPAAGAAEKVSVSYQLKSAGGGIGEVRVFHNGKLVSSDGVARPLAGALAGGKVAQQTSEKIAGQLRSLAGAGGTAQAPAAVTTAAKADVVDASIEIEPVPGENEISVIAFNGNNSIQSVVRSVAFRSDRPAVAPRLHVLAIGIDEYKDKAANLKFAAKDARDLGTRWRTQAASIYGDGNIFIETLTNAQAGRAAILAKVDEMAARVRPTDHFMLFVASHGVLLGDQYYMVTSDYDGALTPDKLVSSGEIVDFSKRIKALSQLYILDTCHAGGMGGMVTGLYDARVSVLARKMGLHVFASASSAEEALDGHQGNGLFTHALLAGLNNNARADRNADKQISLAELGSYSKDQTREIAATLKHKQEPLIINFGQDTPVYRLK